MRLALHITSAMLLSPEAERLTWDQEEILATTLDSFMRESLQSPVRPWPEVYG